MAKKVKRKRKVQQQRQTNWLLIGGVIAIGVLGLFALLFLSLSSSRASRVPGAEVLTAYCEENPDGCVIIGDGNAPVTIFEISDYGCTHCRTYYKETEPLLYERYVQSGDVKFIILPFALSAATVPAANGGFCAKEQDSFHEYSRAMFSQFDAPDALQREGILRAGTAAGVDSNQFAECLNQSRYNDFLQANIEAAQSAGVTSTPNFFINGEHVKGALPFAAFQQEINSLLSS